MTIKKVHYDEILAGTKTNEYRAVSKTSRFLLEYEKPFIAFHYYKKNRIICSVKKITVIKSPSRLVGQHGIGETCIVIEIGKVREEWIQ